MNCNPKTLDELNTKVRTNMKHFGSGLDAGMELPCGFCGESGLCSYKVMEMEEVCSKEYVCKACGRGMKLIFSQDQNGVSFEMVQTRGEDPPPYMPKIRRAT